MIRLFIAINFDNPTLQALGEFQEKLINLNQGQPVRWVKPSIFHLTLHFLPCKNQEQVEAVKNILARLAPQTRVFELAIGELGAFPNDSDPRVIKIDMKTKDQELANLQASLGKELEKLGFEIDRRPWQPHLTLGRIKLPLPKKLNLSLTPPSLRFRVTKIDLMQSVLFKNGPAHSIVSSCELYEHL